jgi:hypothetical protein
MLLSTAGEKRLLAHGHLDAKDAPDSDLASGEIQWELRSAAAVIGLDEAETIESFYGAVGHRDVC